MLVKSNHQSEIDVRPERLPVFYWHYAWIIVAIAAIVQMVGSSIRMAFGVVIDPLVQTFGWDHSTITVAYAINSIVSALISPAAGWMGDRYGVRKTMIVGGIMYVVGMVVTGNIEQPWQFYLTFGVILGVAQAIFVVPLIPGVMHWYRRHLGWGMGILMAGWGLGPALTAPFLGYLIVHSDWQRAFWSIGVGSAVIMIGLIYFYKNTPSDAGTTQYGALQTEVIYDDLLVDKVRVKAFVKYMKGTAAYYNMSSIHFLGCVGHAIILVYVVPLAVQQGLSLVSAATILTVMSVISIPSRLIVPVISEKMDVRMVMAIFFFLQGAAVIMLFWASDGWMFYLFAVVFGIGYGGESGGFPILNRKYYGHAPQGSPYGFQMLWAGLGMALGGWIGGVIFDITGGYGMALYISIIASFVGTISIAFLEPTDDLLIPEWDVGVLYPSHD